jgi:hypothetical protein
MTAKQTKRFKKKHHTQKGGNIWKGIQNAVGLRVKGTPQTTGEELNESNHSTTSIESTGSTQSDFGMNNRFAANNKNFPGGKKNVLQRKNIKRTKRKRVKNRNV